MKISNLGLCQLTLLELLIHLDHAVWKADVLENLLDVPLLDEVRGVIVLGLSHTDCTCHDTRFSVPVCMVIAWEHVDSFT